jgi:Phosphotransferase enzyme family
VAATPSHGHLPGYEALREACAAIGLDATGARLLHHRSNAVYLLPRADVVARLSPVSELRQQRAETAVSICRWLAAQDTELALAPIPGRQPIITPNAVATFWPFRDSAGRHPELVDIAGLLRRLHALAQPAFPVPTYQPLHRLREALTLDGDRPDPALAAGERGWLRERVDALVDGFSTTQFPLGIGLIHGDAHSENVVLGGNGWVLIDWDQTCLGPRELDLVTGLPDHFHVPARERTAFLEAYGYDLTRWPGWRLLRDITELHSLASYIRLAPGKAEAAQELRRRLRSLLTADRSARWRAIA